MENNQNTNNNIEIANYMCYLMCIKGLKRDHPHSYVANTCDKILSKFPDAEKGAPLAYNLLVKKVQNYGVNITPPDWLIYYIDFCANGNPGYLQLLYKELLVCINNFKYHGSGIKPGYRITVDDVFRLCWKREHPIILNPMMEKKYSKLWDDQKIKDQTPDSPDNRVDTPEYWLDVMEK